MSTAAGARLPARARRSPPPVPASGHAGRRGWRQSAGLWIGVACVGLAALSLLGPSNLVYDPWSWVIWGREILHGELLTAGGPSWKPLPVLFTTVFGLLGSAAPFLWLVVARAGGLLAVVMTFRVARRLAGTPGGLFAGAVAALQLVILQGNFVMESSGFAGTVALGNSEGILLALILVGVERHWDGRPDHAFLGGLGTALLRPEAWPFLGLYALWMLVRVPAHRRLVLGGLALLPVLWFGPELWGSGSLFRGAERATQAKNLDPYSPASFPHPGLEVLKRTRWYVVTPIKVGAVVALGWAVIAWLRRRGERRLLAVALGAVAWLALVALMAEADRSSGNPRYLMPYSLGVAIVGAVGFARVGQGLAWIARRRPAPAGRGRLVPGAAFALVALAAVPGTWPRTYHGLPRVWRQVGYEARLRTNLDRLVDRAGGTRRILACGQPFAGRYDVPLVAYRLGVHGRRVGLRPKGRAIVFRAPPEAHRPFDPPLPARPTFRKVAKAGSWRLVAACPTFPDGPRVRRADLSGVREGGVAPAPGAPPPILTPGPEPQG